MNRPLSLFWHRMNSSLYFLPGTIVTLSMLLAWGLLAWANYGDPAQFLDVYWLGEVDSARAFLATVAGATIGIAGVAFSVVIVALTLASNQFCPRVLEHFVEDPINRVFFGLLLGNFSFSLTILASLKDQKNLPSLALIVCFAYTLIATGYFIYFIHHLASSLQIDSIVRVVQTQTEIQIAKLKDRKTDLLGAAFPVLSAEVSEQSQRNVVPAGFQGYIQVVDYQRLLALSRDWQEPLALRVADGDFVVPDTPLIEPLQQQLSDQQITDFQDCFESGHQRYLAEDISYGFREIVDIAIKAISPAINDPTTAVLCLDTLSSMMQTLFAGGWPPRELQEDGGRITFERGRPQYYLRLCCLQTIHFGRNNPMVLHGVLHFLGRINLLDDSAEWKQEVERAVRSVIEAAGSGSLSPLLREEVEAVAGPFLERSGKSESLISEAPPNPPSVS